MLHFRIIGATIVLGTLRALEAFFFSLNLICALPNFTMEIYGELLGAVGIVDCLSKLFSINSICQRWKNLSNHNWYCFTSVHEMFQFDIKKKCLWNMMMMMMIITAFTLQHTAVTWRPLLPDELHNEPDLDKELCRENTETHWEQTSGLNRRC